MSRTLRNYNGTYTLWRNISFCAFVDQYVLLLIYKFHNIITDITECHLMAYVELKIELCK